MNQLLKFSDLLNRFRLVKRRVFSNYENRRESDVDHSYMLGMMCWYIINTEKLNLNLEKVFMYALTHDLVEVYAGDVYFYNQTREVQEIKKQKEKIALEKLILEFPEFKNLHSTISDYEKRQDNESKFVYAVDKIQPVIQIYTWIMEEVGMRMV